MEHKLFALEKNSMYKAQETAFQKDQVNTPTIQLFKVYFYMHTCFKKNKNFKIEYNISNEVIQNYFKVYTNNNTKYMYRIHNMS